MPMFHCIHKTPPFAANTALNLKKKKSRGKMSLSAKDKEIVKAFWAKVSGRADNIGGDAVAR